MSETIHREEYALSPGEIRRLVNQWIGVNGGYLADFTYRSHADFYPEYCDLDINPNDYDGTTRERFIEILTSQPLASQARIVRGALQRFPLDREDKPATRTPGLQAQMLGIAERCDGYLVRAQTPRLSSVVVQRAIADAEALIHSEGATSGVDRVHTALHGYLISVCNTNGYSYPSHASMTAMLKILRKNHPALLELGPRSGDLERVLNSCGTIMDALNTVRNNASVAHPNDRLLEKEEAILAINAARTILSYLSSKFDAS